MDQFPQSIRQNIVAGDLSSAAEATRAFCRAIIDAVADSVAVVKPQAAFFERLGPWGMNALADTIKYARRFGLIVLLDGKRGDIGSTAEAYADAYLGSESPWGCDALTVNPYLGEDTLVPFLDTANQRGAGVFILVKTSNPGSGFLQDLRNDGATVFMRVADTVHRASKSTCGTSGYGNCGAVVGATYPEQLAELRRAMPHAWLLIPGFGAQGGTANDVAAGFDSHGYGAIVNSSRGIINAFQDKAYTGMNWQDAIARAARDMSEQLPKPKN